MDRATLAPSRADLENVDALDQRQQALESWVRRRVGNIDHERRVLQVAEALFDLTRDLHALGRRSKWALQAASLLHDVGRSIDPKNHARVGARMILCEPSLSFPASIRRTLAYLTLYHRGPVPDLGDDQVLGPADDRAQLRTVLGLLRAADTLDSRSIAPPHLLLRRQGRSLHVSCLLRRPCSRARKSFSRPKKFRLLEETMGCTVQVEVQYGAARMLAWQC